MTRRPGEETGAVVVLAAGASARFGADAKQLATLDDAPLLVHVVDAALRAELRCVLVVLGHEAAAIAKILPHLPEVIPVNNPDYATGQASSLHAGLAAVGPEVDFIVVLLGDQPGIQPSAIRAVSAAVQGGARVARARYEDGPAHPIAFHREVWPSLSQLEGDEGARRLLVSLGAVDVAVDGRRPRDVDTPADLAAIRGESPREG